VNHQTKLWSVLKNEAVDYTYKAIVAAAQIFPVSFPLNLSNLLSYLVKFGFVFLHLNRIVKKDESSKSCVLE